MNETMNSLADKIKTLRLKPMKRSDAESAIMGNGGEGFRHFPKQRVKLRPLL